MSSKYTISIALIILTLGCKKDSSSVNPNRIRLAKIEYFTQNLAGRPTTPPSGDQLFSYSTFTYDSQGRLTSEQIFSTGSPNPTSADLVRSYTMEYNSDGKISKITDIFKNTCSFIWSGKTVMASKTGNGYSANFSFTLNDDGLPIRRTEGTTIAEAVYDTNGNINKTLYNGIILTEYGKYDLTKLNPRACSYELRIYPTINSNEGFSGQSHNWPLKIDDPNGNLQQDVVIESNEQGYPTVTKQTNIYRINTTKYTYVTL